MSHKPDGAQSPYAHADPRRTNAHTKRSSHNSHTTQYTTSGTERRCNRNVTSIATPRIRMETTHCGAEDRRSCNPADANGLPSGWVY